MDIKDWIAAARAHNKGLGKLTQQELADWLSVSKQNISAWERGHHEPSFSQMQRISALTGYSLPGYPAASPKQNLSDEVLKALAQATPTDLLRIENQIRAYFGMPSLGALPESSPKRDLQQAA
jgi:transcriptional regulator with XRE-family HTH domain